MLRAVIAESLALGGEVGASWLSDFTAFLSLFDALPESGLFEDGVPCSLPTGVILEKFDRCFYGCWCDLPPDLALLPLLQCRVVSTSIGLLLRVGQTLTPSCTLTVVVGQIALSMCATLVAFPVSMFVP